MTRGFSPTGMLSYHEILIRLLFAAFLGAAIGVERDVHRRPAGIRTSMLVCMATALFTILSGEIAHRMGDTSGTRIASNIVQGIGFLGAGAILKDAMGLVGMTTAATIFAEAAIGMAVGGGLYLGFAQYNEIRKNRRTIQEQQDRLIAQQDQLQKANQQLTQVIESNKKVLDTLSLGEMLRVNYGAGVCLIYGSYTFVEAGTGRPLRIP